jgi:hypothetical protein
LLPAKKKWQNKFMIGDKNVLNLELKIIGLRTLKI